MLKIAEDFKKELLDFCKRDSFGTKIAGYFKTYGFDFPFALFYVQIESNGKITAAIAKIYGCAVLCADDSADFEEIREFLLVTGFSTLSCELGVCQKLNFPVTRQGHIVEFCENEREKFKSKINYYPNLPKIYDLLTLCDFDLGEKADWMADISMRQRKDISLWSTIENEDEVISCACALFITEDAVFLGCVACNPNQRGAGLGSDNVLNLAKGIGKNKRVNLFCKDTEIVNFYKKLGFSAVGRWAESEFLG